METKKMKLWKKILLVILALFILFVILTLRKFMIIGSLNSISENYSNKTNYMMEFGCLQENNASVITTYYKGEDFITTIQSNLMDSQDVKKLTLYQKDNESIEIIETKDSKIAILNDNITYYTGVATFSPYITGSERSIGQKLLLAAISKITTEKYNDKECFVIEITDSWKVWVDKETGVILREINGNFVNQRNYEFDIVKDEDIIKPNISDCEIRQNND